MRSRITATLTFTFAITFAWSATAAELKNLKVLKPTEQVEKGMKELSKGLGVKCEACHIKGKYDSDDAPAKAAAREFLSATVGESNPGKRDAALTKLLAVLELKAPKRAESVWEALGKMEKR